MSSIRTLFTLLFVVALFNSTPAQGHGSIDGFQDLAATTPSVLHSQDCEGDDPDYLLCSAQTPFAIRSSQRLLPLAQASRRQSTSSYHSRAPPVPLQF